MGEGNRQVENTDYNTASSRSHTIFQLIIESRLKQTEESTEPQITISQLSLIDLAGSEKANTDIDRRKEGSFINKSLLTLGSVIHRLTHSGNEHIPFRDSKLTRILQPSLTGQGRICVIGTISPCANNLEESLNTLKFASRARRMVPRPEYIPVLDDKALLQKYKTEIEKLRSQLVGANSELEKRPTASAAAALTDTERQAYEEQLLEARLARTALKERIDHLTKLILTSTSMTNKTLIDRSPRSSTTNRGASTPLLPMAGAQLRTALSLESIRMSRKEKPRNPTKQLSDDRMLVKNEITIRDDRIHTLEAFIKQLEEACNDETILALIKSFRANDAPPIHKNNEEMLLKQVQELTENLKFTESDVEETRRMMQEQADIISSLQTKNTMLEEALKTGMKEQLNVSSTFSNTSLKLILSVMNEHVDKIQDSEGVDETLVQTIQELSDALESTELKT